MIMLMVMMFIPQDQWISRYFRSRDRTEMKDPSSMKIRSESKNEKIEMNPMEEKYPKNSIKRVERNSSMDSQSNVARKRGSNDEIVVRKVSALTKKSSYRTMIHSMKNVNGTKFNGNVLFFNSEEFIEEIRKQLKLRFEDRESLSKLMKMSGLNKEQLRKFVYEKNNEILHLQSLISILDFFNLMILIVPK